MFCFKCGKSMRFKNNVPKMCDSCFLKRREERNKEIMEWTRKKRKRLKERMNKE